MTQINFVISDFHRDVVMTIKRYIDEHVRADLRVDTLARRSGYDRGHFSKMFSAVVGKPPHEYVMERRMEVAKDLMTQFPRLTDQSVATMIGYVSKSAYLRTFHRRFGCAPNTWRKKALEEKESYPVS